MKKYYIYFWLIIGALLIFVPVEVPFSSVYLKVIGVGIFMFSLYSVSSKLSSKEDSHDNQNLEL